MTDPGRFEDFVAKARRIEEALADVRGRATSPGGLIEVTVDHRGRVLHRRIEDAALTAGARRLEAALADTEAAACEDAESQADALRVELRDDPRVARLMEHIETGPGAILTRSVRPGHPEPVDDDEYFASLCDDPLGRRTGG